MIRDKVIFKISIENKLIRFSCSYLDTLEKIKNRFIRKISIFYSASKKIELENFNFYYPNAKGIVRKIKNSDELFIYLRNHETKTIPVIIAKVKSKKLIQKKQIKKNHKSHKNTDIDDEEKINKK